MEDDMLNKYLNACFTRDANTLRAIAVNSLISIQAGCAQVLSAIKVLDLETAEEFETEANFAITEFSRIIDKAFEGKI